jgi:integrase/recombinase XerD
MKVQEIHTPNGKKYLLLDNEYNVIEPVKMFLKQQDVIGKSRNTLKNYAHHLKLYYEFLDVYGMEAMELGSDNDKCSIINVFSEFIYWLKFGTLSTTNLITTVSLRENSTINIIIMVVTMFYRACAIAGLCKSFDLNQGRTQFSSYKGVLYEMVERKKQKTNIFKLPEKEKEIRALSREEYNVLINCCHQLRDKILLAFMFEGGMRVGEALGTHIEDIVYRENKIKIVDRRNNENDMVVKNKDIGAVFLPNYVFKWIQEYILNDISEYESDYFFLTLNGENNGKAMEYQNTYDLFKRLSKNTGIKVTPHYLRHGYAQEREAMGWDIIKISKGLRHKQISTTRDYLGVYDPGSLANTVEFYKQKGIEIGGLFVEQENR